MDAGINRIRRATISALRPVTGEAAEARHDRDVATEALISAQYGQRFIGLKTLGDRVARRPLTSGNTIAVFETGDEAYAAMCRAIDGAQKGVLLETYIFDNDAVGQLFVQSLAGAVKRGVTVRVLIDAVGVRYSVPSVLHQLREADVAVDLFNGKIVMGLRLPYANLRTHRKILVVDGRQAFTGGMNIRKGFSAEFAGSDSSRDTHFEVTGPVVADLFSVAALALPRRGSDLRVHGAAHRRLWRPGHDVHVRTWCLGAERHGADVSPDGGVSSGAVAAARRPAGMRFDVAANDRRTGPSAHSGSGMSGLARDSDLSERSCDTPFK